MNEPGVGIYKCWIPDRGQTVDTGRQMERSSPRDAAAFYAEMYCGFQGDPFNEITVRVRCERFKRDGGWHESGFEWDIVVNVVPIPCFEVDRVVQHGVVKREDWRNEQVD